MSSALLRLLPCLALLLFSGRALAQDPCKTAGPLAVVGDLADIVAGVPAREVTMLATSEYTTEYLVEQWTYKLAQHDAETLDRNMRAWAGYLRNSGDRIDRAEYRNVLAAILAGEELLSALVRREAGDHLDALRQFNAQSVSALRRALAHFEATLADEQRRAAWEQQLEAGGETLSDGIVKVEILRRALNRKELAAHSGVPGDVATVAAAEQAEIQGILDQVLTSDFSWEKGFHGKHGAWEVQVLSPGAGQPKVLALSKAAGDQGELVLVQAGLEPKVLRVEWKPSESIRGALTVLGAEGSATLNNKGLELKAMAYVGKGELQLGYVTFAGYAGGIGIKVTAKDGKLSAGAIAGLGGEVQIDVLAIAQDAGRPITFMAEELAETATLKWRIDDNGDWILPNGSTAKKEWVRAMMNRPGFHVLP